jgi:autotransporter-associated beta strand protein
VRAIRAIGEGKRPRRGGKARRWALATAVAPLLAGVVASPARAADRTWDGGGASDDFADALNWAGDALPVFNAGAGGVGDNLIFAATTRLTPFNNTSNTNQTALSLRFDLTAGAFNIGGNLIVVGTTAGGQTGNGNITNQSTNTATFGAEVRQRTGLVNAAAGDIVFNGAFGVGNTATVNDRASTFAGAFNTYLNGKVTMSGALTRQGTGTTFITNDTNDYIGETRIQQGAVRISVPNALGSTANAAAGACRSWEMRMQPSRSSRAPIRY